MYKRQALITEKVGSDAWLTDLSVLEKLNDCIDTRTITKFNNIKKKKKQQLACNNHGGFAGGNPPDMNGGQTATA